MRVVKLFFDFIIVLNDEIKKKKKFSTSTSPATAEAAILVPEITKHKMERKK